MERNSKAVRWKMRIPLLFTAKPLRITSNFVSVILKGGFFCAEKHD